MSKKDENRIFLCHASEDKKQVISVYESLKAAGFNPWLDKMDLLPGQDWDKEIRIALKTSSFIIIFFSKHSVSKRGYVQRELKLALDTLQEIPGDQIFIIPVRLDHCQIPESFKNIHHVDLFDPNGFSLIAKSIEATLGRIKAPTLRSYPIASLTSDDYQKMLIEKNFLDKEEHASGETFKHQFKKIEYFDATVVVDNATKLMWQQGGSEERFSDVPASDSLSFDISFDDEDPEPYPKYFHALNNAQYGGFSDWRFPSLEEAISLVERRIFNDLFLDPIFDRKQWLIATSDRRRPGKRWCVNFKTGSAGIVVGTPFFIKAVREF